MEFTPSISKSLDLSITKETLIGYFKSKGSANNKPCFRGPNGGVYYYTESRNKRMIDEKQYSNIELI